MLQRSLFTLACPSVHSPQKVYLLLQGDDDWVKLNAEQYGFYRVQYPDELWHRLTLVAARVVDDVPMLPEVEFAGLLDDAWALNEAGGLPIHIFLNLTRYSVSYTECSLIRCPVLRQGGDG